MLRFTLIPLFLLIISAIVGIISFVIYKTIKRGISATYKKGAKLANEQQQKWANKEQRKKLPSLVQKGFEDFEHLKESQSQLPSKWKIKLEPLVLQAKEILDEVAFDYIENESEKALTSVRPFFHHSLDALLQFSQKLNIDHQQMTHDQSQKADRNLVLFEADLSSHLKVLRKGRRLDFDVLMDVIKARLKK